MEKQVERILKQSGYEDNRIVDISETLKLYDEYGYIYNEKQKKFLERYAYLEIEYHHPIWSQEIILRLNPIEAQTTIEINMVCEYNELLDDKLLIIGDIERDNMTLFLSEKGMFYSCFDDCIIKWGECFETVLSMLVNGRKGELIIMD